MTDLEITKLCAEAMGWRPAGERKDFDTVKAIPVEQFPGAPHYQYAPLHDKHAALTLVEKFRISVNSNNDEYQVWPTGIDLEIAGRAWTFNVDLVRAICECVAKMQAEKLRHDR